MGVFLGMMDNQDVKSPRAGRALGPLHWVRPPLGRQILQRR